MNLHVHRANSQTNSCQAPAAPLDDYILVSRATLDRLYTHLSIEQERFPARRLRQALKIIQHILGGHSQNAA
ncbi:MAG: hypothetical protein SH847_10495 [Roseiflexaceae bacterium]|nr:hypothetical protein [Roseiflexaceae bacterium]